jgi:hypothetical protein
MRLLPSKQTRSASTRWRSSLALLVLALVASGAVGTSPAGAVSAAAASVSYRFDGVAFYQFGDPADLVSGAPSANPDSGFVRITDNGTSTFSGTIGFVSVNSCGNGDFSASYPVTLGPGDHVSVSVDDESSNYGGYNGPCFDPSNPQPQNGAQFVLNGTVTAGGVSQGVNLTIYDKDIHSGVSRTNPFGTTLDNYILQGGDPYGQDTGDDYETTQAPGPFVCSSSTGSCQTGSPVSVTKVKPSALGQGAAKAKLTITGSGFENGATVSVDNSGVTVNSVTFVSSTELKAKLSVASDAPTGPSDVTVTNPDQTVATCGGCLTIDVGPEVDSVSPASGDRGTTLNVQVFGANFDKGAKVTFGKGVTVNSHTFVDSGEIDATITISSTAATGGRTVTVINRDKGTGSCPDCFTVT